MKALYKKEAEVAWEDHFMTDNGKIKWILTHEKDDSPVAVMKIFLEKNVTLPDHRHAEQPDLLYVLEGKATMYIDGEGEFPLEAGMIVMVPINTLHAIRNIEEDLLLYNVFSPAIKYVQGGSKK